MAYDVEDSPEMSPPGAQGPPIPGYEDLSVEEILARLPEVPHERIEALIEWEIGHKHRKTLLEAFEDQREPVPIPEYHRLTAREIVRRLRAMPRPDVRKLRRHEHRHKGRQTILDAIDRRLAAD